MADDIDPADWLASQFGAEEPEKPARRRGQSARQQPAPSSPPVQPPAVPFTPAPVVPAVPDNPFVAEPPPAASTGGGFNWGLTPGGSPPVAPAPAPTPTPTPTATPVPSQATAWDVPTVATPIAPERPPANVEIGGSALVRQDFPGFGAPVDPSIDGVTEVLGAQPIGLSAPEDEGVEVSAIDSLFGDSAFVEYQDTLVPAIPPRGSELVVVTRSSANSGGRGPIPPVQKVLMSVAGGLVGVLLLIVLFVAGTKIGENAPAPVVVADPTSSASAGPVVGPVSPGEHLWDSLLGGECIAPFVSQWEDTFTVVPCSQPHPAQLVYVGIFPASDDPDYPGVDDLQKFSASLCAVPAVIDYGAAGSTSDLQILASFAADEQDWLDGNRTFYCFVSATGGAMFSTSIAVPQALPTATATPTP